jgi:hypothetical protein
MMWGYRRHRHGYGRWARRMALFWFLGRLFGWGRGYGRWGGYGPGYGRRRAHGGWGGPMGWW